MVAATTAEGAVLHVGRSGSGVTIAEAAKLRNGHELPPAEARKLVVLLDEALNPGCGVRGLLGGVTMTNERPLYVKRWAHAVGITTMRDGHSGWSIVMRNQVVALRDAIAAVVGDAPQVQSATVIEPDTHEQVNAELPALTTTRTHTPSTAPVRSAPGMQRV